MSNELGRYYELLGVAPGTSGNELKEAYRDMAKVWHPDRFAHDPRLRQKAQERLKEINEAYGRLTSGRAGRRPRANAPTPEPHSPAPSTTARPSKRPRLILLTAAAFCAVFIAALIALVPTGAGRADGQTPPSEQEPQPARDARQPDAPAAQPTRGKERPARQPNAEAKTGAAPDAAPPRSMPTVTVTVDTATGLLATRDCPAVSRMTYPAGREPQQYCAVAHRAKTAGVIRDARTPDAGKPPER
ncbi:MAG TPA: DnaJ domain-containing protein [Pyrinomonadaceae bacterium]|nr:DnaJ domain-containing protein [Pyrinomonadaceae bacterium]